MQVPKRKSEKFTNLSVDPHMTPEKFAELKIKLDKMKKDRPHLASEVARLAQNGDFSENAEYQIAKGKLRGLNRRMDETRDLINKANIIVAKKNSGVVALGSRVTVESNGQERTYQILGSSEAKPESGIISHNSPLGAALMGKKIGEEFKVTINNKEKNYVIVKIA